MPLVSVVTPAYNRASLLRQAIRSALAQTYQDMELIIVDDGSTDETPEVVAAFPDERIRYIRQENRQRCVARNNGVAQARGEFIALLDSDDLWFPDKLRLQVDAFARHPEVGVVFSSPVRVNARTEFPYPLDFIEAGEGEWVGNPREDLLVANRLSCPTVVFRRVLFDTAGGFDAALPHGEDWDMWIRLSQLCDFCKLRRPLAAYRVHDDNRTNNPLTTMRADLIILDKHLPPLTPHTQGGETGGSRTTRLRAEMTAYARRGFQAFQNDLPEGEAWIGEAYERAVSLGEPEEVERMLLGLAVEQTSYSDLARQHFAGVLGRAMETLRARGARVSPDGAVREFWATWVHACYALGDFIAAHGCARRIGLLRAGRGERSVAVRSFLKALGRNGRGRIRFAIEEELPRIVEPERAG